MTLSDGGRTSRDGGMTYTYTPSVSGTYDASIECTLFSPTRVVSRTLTAVRVNAAVTAAPDTVAPVVGSVSPLTASIGTSVNMQATYSDNVGVSGCTLYIDNVSQGDGTLNSTAVTKGHIFSTSGTHTARFACRDAAGNTGSSVLATVNVAASVTSPSVDTVAPSTGAPSPVTATVGIPITLSASYSDAVGVNACSLYVDGALLGTGTLGSSLTSGSVSYAYTFMSGGVHTVRFTCTDVAGNRGEGISATVNVSAPAASPDVARLVLGAFGPMLATIGVH